MAADLTVILENRPGTLAEMGQVLGNAGINIDGMCGFICAGEGVIHILVEDGAGASAALKGAGIEVRAEREVLVLDIEDRPGALGEIAGRIAAAGADLDLVYLAATTRLVLGADDLDKARAAV
jgi:hypothetical protein